MHSVLAYWLFAHAPIHARLDLQLQLHLEGAARAETGKQCAVLLDLRVEHASRLSSGGGRNTPQRLQGTFLHVGLIHLRVMQIASVVPPLEPQPSATPERRRWCIFRCRRSASGHVDEDIFGKKWVTLTDAAGNRCAIMTLSRTMMEVPSADGKGIAPEFTCIAPDRHSFDAASASALDAEP